jgi:hypothetical protein
MTASLPLLLGFRSQQLIVRDAARQDCPVGEQGSMIYKATSYARVYLQAD